MQNRSYLGTGSPYPTGKSPLVLDIERNIQSVVQQQVENKKSEIKDKRLRVTENEKAILDALDVNSIEGIGDKVALEFGNELDNLKDTWAKKFYEKGGELNTQDKLNLRKDQSRLEQKLKSQASEIKMMADVQKELQIQATRLDKKGIYDYEKTSKWLSEYAKSGKAGSGQFLNGVIFRQPEYGEDFKYKYSDDLKNLAKSTGETVRILNEKTGLYETRTRTPDEVMREHLKSRPEAAELMKDPKWNALVEDMIAENTLNKSKQGFSGIINKNNRDGDGVDIQSTSNFLNDFTEGVLRGSESSIKSIIGKVHKDVGTINDAYYENGNIYLVPLDKKKYGVLKIPLPNRKNKTDVLNFKKDLASTLGLVGTTQDERKKLDLLKADWGDNTEVNPMMPNSLKSTINGLSKSPEEAIKENDKAIEQAQNENKTLPATLTTEKYRDDIIANIKKIIPEAKIEVSNTGKLWWKKHNIIVDGKLYDLSKDSDRQSLSDWIIENSKYKEKFKERFGYGGTEAKAKNTTFTTEQEAVITKLMKQNPDFTRDEIIKELGY